MRPSSPLRGIASTVYSTLDCLVERYELISQAPVDNNSPIFVNLKSFKAISANGLTQSVNRTMKEICIREPERLKDANLTRHSGRIGYITALSKVGLSYHRIIQFSNHFSLRVLEVYDRDCLSMEYKRVSGLTIRSF